jgi:tetratricopeptide (TPR) repeat protein
MGDDASSTEASACPTDSEQPSPDKATEIAEIDRLLHAGRLDEADAVLATLRDEAPDDPLLSWRLGRLRARQGDPARTLAAYAASIDYDDALLDDRDFYAELHELLRNRRVRAAAFDLALNKMGTHGHKFLLEVVNDSQRPLGYELRRRAIDELATRPESASLIDVRLHLALDLMQATQSSTPCATYLGALDRIESHPDRYFLSRVERAPLPESTPGEDPNACEALPERRREVFEMLQAMRSNASE